MVKIAQFIMVQQAFEGVQPLAEFGNKGYKSNGEDYGSELFRADAASNVNSAIKVEPPASKAGVIETVQQIMDQFIMRGTAGLI